MLQFLRLEVPINYRHDTSMRVSTKHAIAQRLLGVVGGMLFIAPIWLTELHSITIYVMIFGWLLLAFAIFSGIGRGPWGR
jgi:hypothetical protein